MGFCRFFSPHGNDKVINARPAAQDRARRAFLIAGQQMIRPVGFRFLNAK